MKATTYYSRPIIEVYLHYWFPFLEEDTPIDSPKPQPVQGGEDKKIATE
jgi:hypothetical protein